VVVAAVVVAVVVVVAAAVVVVAAVVIVVPGYIFSPITVQTATRKVCKSEIYVENKYLTNFSKTPQYGINKLQFRTSRFVTRGRTDRQRDREREADRQTDRIDRSISVTQQSLPPLISDHVFVMQQPAITTNCAYIETGLQSAIIPTTAR
jgi:hypothetical protein